MKFSSGLLFTICLCPLLYIYNCSQPDLFERGLGFYQQHRFKEAVECFKQVPVNHINNVSAKKHLILSLTKLFQYREAGYYLDTKIKSTNLYTLLEKELHFHKHIYNLISSHINAAPSAKQPPLSLNFRHKKIAHVLLDIVLNKDETITVRKFCAENINHAGIIENALPLLRSLTRSDSEEEQVMVIRIWGNYLIDIMMDENDKVVLDEWPGTETVKALKKQIVDISGSGNRRLKHEVIRLCNIVKDRTALEILIPFLYGTDGDLARTALTVLGEGWDIGYLLEKYDSAPSRQRRNILKLLRSQPDDLKKLYWEKALSDSDWVVRWLASNELMLLSESGESIPADTPSPPDDRPSPPADKKISSKNSFHRGDSDNLNHELKNIILVSLDMLRADRLASYGFPEYTSPFLDRFSRNNTQFAECVAQAAWTLPSHVSMFTSLYPNQHGTNTIHDYISRDHTTLAELMGANGYLTAAHVSINPNISSKYGFEKGFDLFEEQYNKHAVQSMDYVIRWFNWYSREKSEGITNKPFFLFLHINDIHDPYPENLKPFNTMYNHLKVTPETVRNEKVDMYRMYHSMIYYVDQQLGRMFNSLKQTGLWDNSIIIITSDHGEAFGEHKYFGHGFKGHTEEIMIPIFIKIPFTVQSKIEYDKTIQIIDIAPTLLALAGIKIPRSFQGDNVLSRNNKFGSRNILSETPREGLKLFQSLIIDNYKYIAERTLNDLKINSEELYDINVDPGEHRIIQKQDTELYDKFREQLEKLSESLKAGEKSDAQSAVIDAQTVRTLKNLGYIE